MGGEKEIFPMRPVKFLFGLRKKKKERKGNRREREKEFLFLCVYRLRKGKLGKGTNAEIAEAQGSHWREKGLGDTWLL